MQENIQPLKINSYHGWLLLLNSVFWLLIGGAVAYFVLLAFIGFLVVFGFSYLHALGGHILISAAYIPILAFVYYLKDHIQRLANKEDGKVITDKDLMWKKEIVYWMRIYLFLY